MKAKGKQPRHEEAAYDPLGGEMFSISGAGAKNGFLHCIKVCVCVVGVGDLRFLSGTTDRVMKDYIQRSNNNGPAETKALRLQEIFQINKNQI